MIVVVMGVAGSGKTTIGRKLAAKLGWPFYDGDDYHPQSNVVKMRNGQPLLDEDRIPWLVKLNKEMRMWTDTGNAVLACSALKESYREIMQQEIQELEWVYLDGTKALIENRINSREGHFMKSDMLDSQFNILEKPSYALSLNVAEDPDKLVSMIKNKLGI